MYIPPPVDAAKARNEDGNVFVIRMSNPPYNILTKATRLKLLKDLEVAIADESVRAIVIVGSETAFSVGADLTELNMSIGSSEKANAMNAYVEVSTLVYGMHDPLEYCHVNLSLSLSLCLCLCLNSIVQSTLTPIIIYPLTFYPASPYQGV